jgi:hypothetical protein
LKAALLHLSKAYAEAENPSDQKSTLSALKATLDALGKKGSARISEAEKKAQDRIVLRAGKNACNIFEVRVSQFCRAKNILTPSLDFSNGLLLSDSSSSISDSRIFGPFDYLFDIAPTGSSFRSISLKNAIEVMTWGTQSMDCAAYLQRDVVGKDSGTLQWLFWRKAANGFEPKQPPTTGRWPAQKIGQANGYEIWVTAKSCFDEFIIDLQRATQNTSTKANISPGAATLVNP